MHVKQSSWHRIKISPCIAIRALANNFIYFTLGCFIRIITNLTNGTFLGKGGRAIAQWQNTALQIKFPVQKIPLPSIYKWPVKVPKKKVETD